MFIKGIRLDSKAFWVKTEMLVYNQDETLVAMSTNLLVWHRTQEQQTTLA